MTQKVNEIIAHYSPNKTISLQKAQQPQLEIALVNKEVVFTVNQYKDNLKEIISKRNEIDNSLKRILSCVSCSNVDEKLNHLNKNTDELQRLKTESDSLYREIVRQKIKLLNEDGNLLFFVKKAGSPAKILLITACIIIGFVRAPAVPFRTIHHQFPTRGKDYTYTAFPFCWRYRDRSSFWSAPS